MIETQETPSVATNELISLAQRIGDGEDVSGELHQQLTARIAFVEKDLEFVTSRAEARGEKFLEDVGPLYDALLEHIGAYHEGLLELNAYFTTEEPDVEVLARGVEILVQVTAPLIEIQQKYGQVYAGYGPSRFPVINSLMRMLPEAQQNPQVEQELEEVLDKLSASYRERSENVRDSETGADEIRNGCKAAVECIEALKSDVKAPDTHEEHIAALGEALFEIETAAEERRLEMLEGPSVMPAANLFINTARKVMQGELPDEALPAALEAYDDHISENWNVIEAQLDKPIESATIQEELPNTMEIVDAHEDLIDRLREIYSEGFDHQEFELGLQELIELVSSFKDSAQVYVEAADRVGKFVCPACGRANARANRVCEACGVSLPKLVSDEQSDSTFSTTEHGGLEDKNRMVMTENLHTIFKACEDVREELITENEFEQVLNWAYGILSKMRVQGAQMNRSIDSLGSGSADPEAISEEQKTLYEMLAFFLEGVDEWEEGLNEMAKYLDDPSDRHLRLGIKRVWEGATAVHRCKVIGEAANQILAERAEGDPEGGQAEAEVGTDTEETVAEIPHNPGTV